ncbi:DUF177 domain-containing protein [Mucilaginibacter sp. SMC90]|uniref:YceD family protein n=1 Tax=Mucilaginibacter sp. SMC90 TaxID=2929803 RepID=UPI001FB41FAD|nr:DUF177 domain-containing protein [Mucilaginibacter sp. SMC90]UOE50085.1 DUF177 domain-containing protein [Mucilaginibacter sp. SMC90]
MKSLKKYSIPFTGLKLGKHLFEYDIQDDFFDEFEYSLVKKATLHCEVELDKQETMLILNFKIDGTIDANCDRCLKVLPIQLDITEQQIAKFSDEAVDEDEEIITLGKNDHEIDIAGLIYEYINVAVPFISICGEGNTSTCDKEMLDKLNSLSANGEQSEQTDPRWDALRNMNK